jgi:hypothetical protein
MEAEVEEVGTEGGEIQREKGMTSPVKEVSPAKAKRRKWNSPVPGTHSPRYILTSERQDIPLSFFSRSGGGEGDQNFC